MSAVSGVGADERPGLVYEVVEYLVQALVYTPVYFVGIAVIAFPFTLVMLAVPGNAIAGYTLLTYAGWAVVFGQLVALHDYERHEELTGVAEFLAVIATAAYYNVATLLAVSIAVVTRTAIGPEAAVVVALSLPAIDVQASRLYGIGVAYFVRECAHGLGTWIERVHEQHPIRELLLELLTILSSVDNAVPPVVHYLSLDEFTRRRPLR